METALIGALIAALAAVYAAVMSWTAARRGLIALGGTTDTEETGC